MWVSGLSRRVRKGAEGAVLKVCRLQAWILGLCKGVTTANFRPFGQVCGDPCRTLFGLICESFFVPGGSPGTPRDSPVAQGSPRGDFDTILGAAWVRFGEAWAHPGGSMSAAGRPKCGTGAEKEPSGGDSGTEPGKEPTLEWPGAS